METRLTRKTGLWGLPRIIWYTFIIYFPFKILIIGLIVPIHVLDIISKIGVDKDNINILLCPVMLRGTMNLIGAILANTYLDKFIITLISVALITFLMVPAFILLTVQFDYFSKNNINWQLFSSLTISVSYMGESSFYLLLCDQFDVRRKKDVKLFYVFQLVNLWLENFCIVMVAFLERVLFDAGSFVLWTPNFQYPFFGAIAFGILLILFLLINRNHFHQTRETRYHIIDITTYIWYRVKICCGYRPSENVVLEMYEENTKETYELQLKTVSMVIALLPLLILRQRNDYYNFIEMYSKLNTQISNFLVYPHEGRTLTALLNVILLPIAHLKIFPYACKRSYLRDTQKYIWIGYLLLWLAYLCAASLQIVIERNTHPVEIHSTQIRIYNAVDARVELRSSVTGVLELEPYAMKEFPRIICRDVGVSVAKVVSSEPILWHSTVLKFKKDRAVTFIILPDRMVAIKGYYSVYPILINHPKLFFYCGSNQCGNGTISVKLREQSSIQELPVPNNDERITFNMRRTGKFDLTVDGEAVSNEEPYLNGGIYSYLLVRLPNSTLLVKRYTVLPPNVVNIAWIIPQYVLLSLCDVFSRVAVLAFLYLQLPDHLRSLNYGIVYLIYTFGDMGIISLARVRTLGYGSAPFESITIFIFFLVFVLVSLKYKTSVFFS